MSTLQSWGSRCHSDWNEGTLPQSHPAGGKMTSTSLGRHCSLILPTGEKLDPKTCFSVLQTVRPLPMGRAVSPLPLRAKQDSQTKPPTMNLPLDWSNTSRSQELRPQHWLPANRSSRADATCGPSAGLPKGECSSDPETHGHTRAPAGPGYPCSPGWPSLG